MSITPKGVSRFADVLEFVARSRVAPSSRQILQSLRIPRSSGYDLLNQLSDGAVLQRQPTGHWVLGSGFYALALSSFGLGKIASQIDPTLRALQEETQETAQLAVLHHSRVLITHALSSTRSARVLAEVGTELPINWTAAGRVLLSSESDHGLRKLFTHAQQSPTGKAVVSFAAFRREIQDAMRRGYAVELGQMQAGVCSIAAPVINSTGQCIAAVSLVLPINRFLDSRDTLGTLVSSAASRLMQRRRTETNTPE
jgi:DNA-binding IclR family transcriptional regulator